MPALGVVGPLVLGTMICVAALLAGALVAVAGSIGTQSPSDPGAPSPSRLALSDIPPEYQALYRSAATRFGISWALLAGVGKVECDHGRDPDPSCTQEGAVNGAGAGGPMQFLASTWARYGIDGDGDGRADRWDPADAIYGAARYLHASGAPRDDRAALLAYNHATWYAEEVEAWAARYTSSAAARAPTAAGSDAFAGATSSPVEFVAGERAALAPGDGHVAMVPAGVPSVVQAMVVAGNELQSLRYGPGGHPDPRGASEEDCSSTVSYVLYRAGLRPISEILRDNPLAQDYVHWGAPGPGRWVTIYAADAPTPHVFVVIAGLRLDTSHNGTDVGPNRTEDGPRWRVLDGIPTWARWSVRHPPGL
ncbi:MAG TPA: lytic transglycosylase domain-containing protein [Solirubrobacteraceae bacterium]|nr:lytic transglycosylase domain-containing protein [Solirubrobacteraceae bacterium]